MRSRVLFLLCVFLLGSLSVGADGYFWKEIVTDLTLHEDGSASVVETQTFSFEGNYSFAYRYFDLEKMQDISDIHIYEGEKEITQKEVYDEGDQKVVKWYFEGQQEKIFTLKYKVYGLVKKGSDEDSVFWSPVFKDHWGEVRKSFFLLHFPKPVSLNSVHVRSVPEVSAEQSDEHTLSFSVSKLESYQVWDLEVFFPKKIFGLSFAPIVLEKYLFLLVLFVLLLLLPLSVFLKGRRMYVQFAKDPVLQECNINLSRIARVKPGLVGTILEKKVGVHEILATFVDLAQRGYLSVQEKGKDFILRREKKSSFFLLVYERRLLGTIFSSKKELMLSEMKGRFYFARMKEALYEGAVKQRIFNENPESVRKKYAVKSLIYFFSAFILFFFVSDRRYFLMLFFVVLMYVMYSFWGKYTFFKKQNLRFSLSVFFSDNFFILLLFLDLLVLNVFFHERASYIYYFAGFALVFCFCCLQVYVRRIPKLVTLGVLNSEKYGELKEWLKKYPVKEERVFNFFLPYTLAFQMEDVWFKKFGKRVHPSWYAGDFTFSSFNLFCKSLGLSVKK